MPRFLLPFAPVCALFVSLLAQPVHAAAPSKMVHVMVELAGSPLAANHNLRVRDQATNYHLRLDSTLPAAQAYNAAMQQYEQREIDYLRGRGLSISVGRSFHAIWNGFDATLPASQLGKLRSLRNIMAVLPVHTYRPLLSHSVPLVNAPAAWSALGGAANAGRGEMIANIDTGIDIKNPCFKDTGMSPPPYGRRADTKANLARTNNKVIVARAYGDDPNKNYSAADSVGHGTFSGAIEACDYNTPTPLGTPISGMAPAAYLLSYNVFPDGASGTSDSQILAALNAALLDGADVINMSLGGTAGELRLDVEAGAVSNAIKAGVPVVVSAGNAGPTPQSIASPASDPAAISVGAVSNSEAAYATISITGTAVPASLQHVEAAQGSHPFSGSVGPAPLVYVSLGRLPKDDPDHLDANDFAGKDLHGKIALIQRGTLFFETKINNAAKAGAIGAIIFDNSQGISPPGMDVKSATLPAMAVTQTAGRDLLAYLQAHPDAQATLNSTLSTFPETPDVLSYFSSIGYGQNFSIKPDLVAPGQNIYSATEAEIHNSELYNPTGFTSADGTSFSAPHVTGAVALLLQAHKTWTPLQVKSALMDTASTSVYLTPAKSGTPSVMQAGAGMLDVGAAIQSKAALIPASLSFGGINAAAGTVQRTQSVALTDLSGGAGTWQLTTHAVHIASGVTASVPASVTLSTGGKVAIPVHLTVASSVASGDYDGYIDATNGATTVHLPYFVHVASLPIRPHSVLLIDDSTSQFVSTDPTQPPVVHKNVAAYYEQALKAIGKPYTYWNEAKLGPPSLQDLKKSPAVIFFTGANLNGFAAQNSDPESQIPPLSPTDDSVLHSYLDAGGRVFLTGMGAALSDPYFTAVAFGGYASSASLYDTSVNDKATTGGKSPPRPSAQPVLGSGLLARSGLFAGMKKIDFSTAGDGARDNIAVNNHVLGLVGVPGLNWIRGSFDPGIHIFGHPALVTTNVNIAQGPVDGNYNAVDSSDEPTLTHTASYRGRSVFFSFGFEGINNNTGYATRVQVLHRIFQWFNDQPRARVMTTRAAVSRKVTLHAQLTHTVSHAVTYQWQVGKTTLRPLAGPVWYRFGNRGTFRVRVAVTDSLGHTAVSPWTSVHVG